MVLFSSEQNCSHLQLQDRSVYRNKPGSKLQKHLQPTQYGTAVWDPSQAHRQMYLVCEGPIILISAVIAINFIGVYVFFLLLGPCVLPR
jgi:hypothetical protein